MAGLKGLLVRNLFPIVKDLPYTKRRRRYLFSALLDYQRFFDRSRYFFGDRFTMKIFKQAYVTALHIALEQVPRDGYPKGFPRPLNKLVSWLQGSMDKRQVALTILSSYRLMETSGYNDFKTILSDTHRELDIAPFLRKEVRELRGFRFHRKLPRHDFSQTVFLSRGPYGSLCGMEAALSAAALLSLPDECVAVLKLWSKSGTPMVQGFRYLLNSASVDWRVPYNIGKRAGKRSSKVCSVPDRLADNAFHFKSFAKAILKGPISRMKRQIASGDLIITEKTRLEVELRLSTPHSSASLGTYNDNDVIREVYATAEDINREGLGRPFLSRLVFIPKEGGGTRPVTPTNVFVQASLTPVHNLFMHFASLQPGDCTYSEDEVSDSIGRSTARFEASSSFDWSSATDQTSVSDHLYPIVSEVLGDELASSWLILMKSPIAMDLSGPRENSVRYFPSGHKDFGREVRQNPIKLPSSYSLKSYKVGAPMGLRSLWPIYAIFHHCLVNLSKRLCHTFYGKRITVPQNIYDIRSAVGALTCPGKGVSLTLKLVPYPPRRSSVRRAMKKQNYLLKGDDVWLRGKLLSYIYYTLCCLIGVTISKGKSVIPTQGSPPAGEFSKRYFIRGVEITPISPKAIYEADKGCHPLMALDIARRLINFYDGSPNKRIRATEAAGRALSQILSRRSSAVSELSVWASCPVHKGRYDQILKDLGIYLPWPSLEDHVWRPLLAQTVRDFVSQRAINVIKACSELGFTKFGLSFSETSIKLHPASPILRPVFNREEFIPYEVSSLASLISRLGDYSEVDFLCGRTTFARDLEQLVSLTGNLKSLIGQKRYNIRFRFISSVVSNVLFSLLTRSDDRLLLDERFREVCWRWFRPSSNEPLGNIHWKIFRHFEPK